MEQELERVKEFLKRKLSQEEYEKSLERLNAGADETSQIVALLRSVKDKAFEYMIELNIPLGRAQEICSMMEFDKAVFLDRDGTINVDLGNTYERMEVVLHEGAAEGLRMLSDAGFLLIIVTNQGGVEAGNYTIEQVERYNRLLKEKLESGKIKITDIFYCPHERKSMCSCSKPNTGMIKEAVERYSISLENSWMIGDKTSDIKTGENAGCKTILVRTGDAGRDNRFTVTPTFVAENLHDAARYILKR